MNNNLPTDEECKAAVKVLEWMEVTLVEYCHKEKRKGLDDLGHIRRLLQDDVPTSQIDAVGYPYINGDVLALDEDTLTCEFCGKKCWEDDFCKEQKEYAGR